MPFLPLSSFERKAMENLAGLCGIIWIIATYVQFGICQLRVGNGGAGVRCVVCLGFAVKTRRRRHCRCSGVFIVDFEEIFTHWYAVTHNLLKVGTKALDLRHIIFFFSICLRL